MGTAPTKGAAEHEGWQASRWSALTVRFVAFLLPAIGSWLAVKVASNWFWRPEGVAGAGCWILQAITIATIVSLALERQSRRLLPLAFLLNLSLVFPDQAPSRFSVALRAGNIKKLQASALTLSQHGDVNDVATRAVELVSVLSRHDRRTRGHAERVRAYCDVIADGLGLSETDRHKLAWGAILHDVGKLTVPSEVLNKTTKLTDSEWKQLKGHPAASAEMLRGLEDWLGDWVRAGGEHHERWDGDGYPNGLEGNQISLAGRITAVADAYDVITSKRSYKQPMSTVAARAELVRCAGTQFDPQIVRAFLEVSIGKQRNAGAFSWLVELRSLSQLGSGVSSAVLATTAAGTAVVVSAVGGVGASQPAELAFVDESAIVAEYQELPDHTSTSGSAGDNSTETAIGTSTSLEVTGLTTSTSEKPLEDLEATTSTATGPSTTRTATATSTTAKNGPDTPAGTPSSTTASTTSSTPAAPASSTQVLYLTNPGSSDTTSSAVLGLSSTSPTGGSLPNFDTDRNGAPGLAIAKDGVGLATTDLTKHQIWTWTTTSEIVLNGPISLEIWVKERDGNSGETIAVLAELKACTAGCGSGTVLGKSSWSGTSHGASFSHATIDLGHAELTLPAGAVLQLKVIVPDNMSTTDIVLGYDTASHPALLQVG